MIADLLFGYVFDVISFWTGELILCILTFGRHRFLPWNREPESGTRVLSIRGVEMVGYAFWFSVAGVIFYLIFF